MMIFNLVDHGSVFATRPRGSNLREEVRASLADGECLELSLVDVDALSYSFADEFIGALVQELAPDRIRLMDVPDSLHSVIADSVNNRGVDVSDRELFVVSA